MQGQTMAWSMQTMDALHFLIWMGFATTITVDTANIGSQIIVAGPFAKAIHISA